MKKVIVFFAALGCALTVATQLFGQDVPVWSDEFNYAGQPDSSKWTKIVAAKGAVNNELQRYVTDDANCFVDGQYLHIKAIGGGDGITSARLVTRHKGDWLYGRMEARIKLPGGRGTWPAFWMMPSESAYGRWPRSGEIDIMENVGFAKDTIYGTVHTYAYNHTINTQKGKNIRIDGVEDGFHVYSCRWTPREIEISVDGKKYFTFENDMAGNSDTWPFDKPFHIILNLAIGGDWGGQKGIAPGLLPCEMIVDWVRVYK